MENLLSKRNAVIFVLLLTLWRLYLSAELQLHPDEAYYWMWSRNLAPGYFDHSPLVAYFIWFTTLLSKSELWVRLSGTIVALILSLLTWKLAIQLFRSTVVAAGSVMLFNVYPLSMLGLIVITPDIPVFLFWSLSVYIFWQIMRSNDARLWYLLGFSFGLALLSKYTALLLLPCLFLYLVCTEDRHWLKTRYPYLALLIGFFCFLPVVYWNSGHGWVSFEFQLNHGLNGQDYSITRLAEYTVGQLLVAGPVTWLLGLYAAFAWFFRKNKEQLFLILMAVPVIMFFGVSSLRKLAGPNWPVMAYFTFSILISKYYLDGASIFRRSLWYSAFVVSLLLSAIVTLHARFSIIPLASFSTEMAVIDATNSFYGWRELGAELKKYPGMKFAIAPSHQLSAEISYYAGDDFLVHVDENATRPSQFNLWHLPNGLEGKNGFYVWANGDSVGPYANFFSSTTAVATLNILREGIAVRSYQIVPGHNSLNPLSFKRPHFFKQP